MTVELNRPTKRRNLIIAGVGALAAIGAGTALKLMNKGPAGVMNADLIKGDLPLQDPEHKAWRSADAIDLAPVNQTMFYPKLFQATITTMKARALFNGTQLGVQLEWGDEKADDAETIITFRDAVACMIPMNPSGSQPPIFMGAVGNPVYIMQWKASWQRDVEKGFQGVDNNYPRWFNDVYPGHPTLEKLGMTPETAKSFYPGLAAGNPLSQQDHKSPVEELIAEGFGTLTSLPTQRAAGKGVNSKGRWKVNIGTPAPGEDVPALKPGTAIPMAFAVWDGGQQQRGGRKHYVNWITVNLPGS